MSRIMSSPNTELPVAAAPSYAFLWKQGRRAFTVELCDNIAARDPWLITRVENKAMAVALAEKHAAQRWNF